MVAILEKRKMVHIGRIKMKTDVISDTAMGEIR